MSLQPKIEAVQPSGNTTKLCRKCGRVKPIVLFPYSNSFADPDHLSSLCGTCIQNFIGEGGESGTGNWVNVDKACQMLNIPFIPQEWVRIEKYNDIDPFHEYSMIFKADEYSKLQWDEYYQAFLALRKAGQIDDELPEIHEKKIATLKERWGSNYDEEALNYLENLFNGLMNTQNVNGALQTDQAYKICKISYEIDCRIREGSDIDKILGAYEKLVKAAEFTPKNVKNVNDFDSVGELYKYLEKCGWKCRYFDGVTKDVVDETIKNIQDFNRTLYVNESGIGDDITHRIEMLQSVARLEKQEAGEAYYLDNKEYDLDNYSKEGYEGLFADESFDPDA